MKKKKLSKKKRIKLFIDITLVVSIGILIMLCVIFGYEHNWIGFSVCLSLAILLSVVAIPINYIGERYECPQCGCKFKANPYKVFFTNDIFDIGGYPSKCAKLKCPNCKNINMCKKHSD